MADPSGSWTPGTAEQYIDQQVGVLNTNLTSEVIARQTGDRNLQTQLNSEMATRADQDANLNSLINAGIREGGGVQFDTVPTQNSANGITSGGMYSTLRDSNIGFVDDEPIISSNNLVKSGGVKKAIDDILYVETKILPLNDFGNINSYFSAVFTSWPLVRDFKGSYNIKYIIYKAQELQTSLELHNLTIVNGVLTDNGIYETIQLNTSWLDPSLGSYVYKIPFNSTINFIPAPKGFYANNKINDDIGYISAGTTINNLPPADKLHAIAFGIIYNESRIDKNTESIERINYSLEGKRIGFLGDSITWSAQYVSAFADITKCNAVNYGIPATHIAAIGTSYDTTYPPFENRVASMDSNLDGVIVFGGTNDFGHVYTAIFGTFEDYTKAGVYTFYAGLHRTFKQLYDKYRGKPIIIMTPTHHGYKVDTPEFIFNNDGTITENSNPTSNKTFKEYVNAIKEVAAYYSFYVIDAYAESGLNPCLEDTNTNYYFSDGLHLTQGGGNRLGKYMIPKVIEAFKMFT